MSNESDLRLGLSLMRIINKHESDEDNSTVIDLSDLETIRVDKMEYDKIQQATIENIPNIREKEGYIKRYYKNVNISSTHTSDCPNQTTVEKNESYTVEKGDSVMGSTSCSSKDTTDEYIDLMVNIDNIQIAQEYYYEADILKRKIIKNNDNYIFSCIFMIMIKDVMFNIDKNCVRQITTVFKDDVISLLNENKFSYVKKVLCLTNDQHTKQMLTGLSKPLFIRLHEQPHDSLYNDVLYIYHKANNLLKDKLKNKK